MKQSPASSGVAPAAAAAAASAGGAPPEGASFTFLLRVCRGLWRSAARVAGGDRRRAQQIGSLHLSAHFAGVEKAASFFSLVFCR